MEAFLSEVAATAQPRMRQLDRGSILWRAQIGHDWRPEPQIEDEVPCAFAPARMKPLADRAREGRVNPKGVPCLYLASTEDVAVGEVRPGVGSLVSVGQFKVLRDLRLIDCSLTPDSFTFFFDEPTVALREKAVWNDIDRAFAEPVQATDDVADYVPTQILAELFRSEGCEGIIYKSSFADGLNVALFALEDACLINCVLHRIRRVSLDFSEHDSRYYINRNALE